MYRAIFLALIILLSANSLALAAKRIALVVGNNDYVSNAKLENPVNDALLVSESLRKIGFDVITVTNGTHRQMLDAVSDFGRSSTGSDISLFFYAGHGLEVAGRNWILPVNANIEVSSDLPATAVKVDDVLETMELSGARVRMVILDACRNNPLSRSLTRSAGRGLAKIDASAAGTMIVFAAAPGQVALDGTGRNSPFSLALASHITRDGLEVRQMLGRVRQEVMAATDDKQVPWVNEAIVGDFYFTGGAPDLGESKAGNAGSGTGSSADLSVELAFWDSVKDSRNKDLISLYLEKYPNGSFVELAKAIIASLESSDSGISRSNSAGTEADRLASVDQMERDARQFVQRFNQVMSGPADIALSQLDRFYLQSVRFYGKLFSLNDIVADKRKLMTRWPQRDYQVPDSEVSVLCDRASQTCDVQTTVYWSVYNQSRNQHANGVQRTYLELDFSEGVPKVAFEDGENVTNK